MSSVSGTWGAMSRGSRVVAMAGIALLVAVAAGAGALALSPPTPRSVATAPSDAPAPSVPALPPTPSPAASVAPTPTPAPTPRGADPLLGTDGRLTVLLLGSDYRPAKPGNRTDAIMVVSVDPTTGRSAAFSIPRDTDDFPLPGGRTYGARINGLYQFLESNGGHAGQGMKEAVAAAFDLEVDRYVFIGFAGVRKLVDAVGGVDVTLDKAYWDPYYWVTNRRQGWGLPAGTSHLDGDDALIFSRSRKGDNDFGRARRQQLLVMAALDKVRRGGVDDLPNLVRIAADTVRTDLPLERATDLFELFSTVDLEASRRVVFGPRTYAAGAAGGSFSLRLDVCRAWIDRNFPPVRAMGAWPEEPSAAPSAAPPATPASPSAAP